MQRLFSTFPGSWPGFGLLLLRGSVAFAVVSIACRCTISIQSFGLALAIAACLLLGVVTPIAAGAQVLVSLWSVYADADPHRTSWFLAGVCAGLMMIGPGAWSVDALRFGRKRIEVRRR